MAAAAHQSSSAPCMMQASRGDATSIKASSGGRGALYGMGLVIVAIQLLILVQLSRHTTLVSSDSTSLLSSSVSNKLQPLERSNKLQPRENSKNARTQNDSRIPDGSFNDIPIYYSTQPIDSTVSCVGENYQDNAWMYRSCHFTHLCFDTKKKDFVLFQSNQEQEWISHLRNYTDIDTPSIMNNMTVSLGGLNPKWMAKAFQKLEWFPDILSASQITEGYYELPSHYTWVPWHSFAGFNAGHLLWDDLLPIYTLLEMFGMLDETQMTPLLTRYVLKDKALWATCDVHDENKKKCAHLFNKFLPAFHVDPSTFSTTEDFRFQPRQQPQSKYVCARHGAAGLAMLTDHGVKTHGWEPDDYTTTHNMGRGPVFYAFRNYMLGNLGIPTRASLQAPYNVIFSKFSSRSGKRRSGFESQLQAVQEEFDSSVINATGLVMQHLSLQEQAKLASEASVWVTSCGGGAVTATFLPRGSSLILYYDPKGSLVRNKPKYTPARLDWDLFNHLSYVRVHWFPTTDMNSPASLKLLVELIKSELHVIQHL